MYDDFIDRILKNPEYKKVQSELSPPEGELIPREIAPGLSILYDGGPAWTEQDHRNAELWGEICWYITNGPGYCEAAPPHIREYLKRMGAV